MLHVASVCTPCCMLLDVVACCCVKFETGQTFSPVQTGATMLASKSQHCWELLRPFARSFTLRPIHTKGFAPGTRSRGTLREQSSSVCTNDFMGIIHHREQNFHPAKCSTIFNRLNIWEQAPGGNWANLKTLPRVYWPLGYQASINSVNVHKCNLQV